MSVLALAALLTLVQDSRPPVAAAQTPFKIETRLVVLHATVRTERGDLVTGLDRSAFKVYEDGKLQQLSIFRNDDLAVSLGLVIDNSASIATMRPDIEAAAVTCVRESNREDEAFVINFADTPHVDVEFTADLGVLQQGISRPGSTGGTALRDAVNLAATYASEHARHDRRALLIITDGRDNASAVSKKQLVRTLEKQDIAVYAIGLLSAEDPGAARRARSDLDELTAATGGEAYYPQNTENLQSVVVELAHHIRNQYTLGYTPLNIRLDGTYRKIRVEAKGGTERLTVHTRPGYHADSTQPKP
jgi:Ca-activated chloride channel homolog